MSNEVKKANKVRTAACTTQWSLTRERKQPFLVHQKHKARVEANRQAQLPSDYLHAQGTTFWRELWLFLVVGLLTSMAVSNMLTGSLLFGYETPSFPLDLSIKRFLPIRSSPRPELVLTLEELAKFDGSDLSLPLYLALNGTIYDVSANRRTYGPGGSYHHFAGVDATRAYVTGCFATHRTHDVRDFTEEQIQSIRGWATFYATHKTYKRIGTVLLPDIDPDMPLPQDCKQRQKQDEAGLLTGPVQ